MDIIGELGSRELWREYLEYKESKHHISKARQRELETFIGNEDYLAYLEEMNREDFVPPLPQRREIDKAGTGRKRVVYLFPDELHRILKLIAYRLNRYDSLLAGNCYAFRRSLGVKDAVRRIRRLSGKYCLKADISNYFNSIDVPLLLERLAFLEGEERRLYLLFRQLLTADASIREGRVLREKRGAMAGTPTAPFFANIYLADMDWYFEERGITYLRYSDDILLFADTREELEEYRTLLYVQLEAHRLELNSSKLSVSAPGEPVNFLGFCFEGDCVELSEHTIVKIKGKIRRKARALRRWQQRKGLSGEKAAKGFIRAMNRKFYAEEEDDFSWSRWFFPNLTSAKGLAEVDRYMQQYIRYCVTGRHYKGNYRITYATLKEWGYRSLVHEFYDT